MLKNDYAVIMAGGGGTRLWPLSRKDRPKQMLNLGEERALFQMAVDRLNGLFPIENILVVTVAEQAEKLQKLCPEIPAENYLLEPMPRGTASVVGLAAVALQARDPNATMMILTADHHIHNVANFQKLLEKAHDVAQDGYLVTLGIRPTSPSTGYGYIQRGNPLVKYGADSAFEVARFKEKPALEIAQEFVARGDHDWNSGMFIWRVDRILEEFSQHMPELNAKLMQIADAWKTKKKDEILVSVWPTIEPQTIDYGIMENAARAAVLPAENLGWNDVGSWDSLFEVIPADANGNIILADQHIELDTSSSLICSDGSKRLIVTLGVKDLIVVDTGDAVMICPRGESQKVRDLVKLLKSTDQTEYL